jgi:hypothetical protein
MLENLKEFLVGNYESNFVTKTKNQEMRDNQQERLLKQRRILRDYMPELRDEQDIVRTLQRCNEVIRNDYPPRNWL